MTPVNAKNLNFYVSLDRPQLDKSKFYVTKLIDYIYENSGPRIFFIVM